MRKNITANESKIRLTAFLVLVLIILYGFTGIGLIPAFLVADFALRAFNLNAYSLLGYLAGHTATALKLPAKPVYMPPKRFAARIGFAFCLAITILHYTSQPSTAAITAQPTAAAPNLFAGGTTAAPGLATIAAKTLSIIIALFAALESLAGFCAGCYVYNAWIRLRSR